MSLASLRAKLNPKQIAFCQAIAKGGISGTQAAIAAGYSEGAAKVTASRLLTNVNVSSYITALQEPVEEAATLSRQRKRELLKKWAEGADGTHSLQAIKIDNDMTGDNQPVRIEGELTLGGILASLKPSTGLPNEVD